VDQFGPVLVVVAVGADVQVQVPGHPESAQLGFGERPDVPGDHRLHGVRRTQAGQRGQRRRRPGQGAASLHDQGTEPRCLVRESGQERLDMPVRIADPGSLQRVEDDRPVGPPGHGHDPIQLTAEELAEDHPVQLGAAVARIDQGVIDVPQHQHVAHGVTVPAPCRPP
jgi:hypothetical protein